MSYLSDFLFAPERARSPVKSLSGGERNRLLLARLFAKPANVLVLDEPTNDLDIDTLELLEELLADYAGTRASWSATTGPSSTTSSPASWPGRRRRCGANIVGGYSDWQRQRPQPATVEPSPPTPSRQQPKETERASPLSGTRLKREIDKVQARLDRLHEVIAASEKALGDTQLYSRDPAAFALANDRLEGARRELPALEERWLGFELLRETAS